MNFRFSPRWLRRGLQLALLGSCLVLAACVGRVELMGAIAEEEANEVVAALIKAQIPTDKVAGKDGMVGVRVAASDVGRALEVLRANGLPRERFAGMGQVFKKEGLISSPLEERARYVYALSQELSNTLSKIDGVLAARVHVVLPERGTAGETGVVSTAAVFIKHQDGYNLEIIQPQIRRLVTNSIPSLSADRVSVVFVASQARAGAVPAEPAQSVWGFEVPQGAAAGLSWLIWSLATVAALALAALGYGAWHFRAMLRPALASLTTRAP
ncbi:type III secretion system inner membrane ring lipoprotein SctJ [Comamonas endophytica]|uniref:type III secretion system inner membrane ring lipoprotein SctJ n=1 Tax=Comamonas endophytica TaxID=2949090 RepID=UPI00271555D0|nr:MULTISPECIES: type III secretion inner membrane ring lipoprotein SctJ [unclassified Acidovorax]